MTDFSGPQFFLLRSEGASQTIHTSSLDPFHQATQSEGVLSPAGGTVGDTALRFSIFWFLVLPSGHSSSGVGFRDRRLALLDHQTGELCALSGLGPAAVLASEME